MTPELHTNTTQLDALAELEKSLVIEENNSVAEPLYSLDPLQFVDSTTAPPIVLVPDIIDVTPVLLSEVIPVQATVAIPPVVAHPVVTIPVVTIPPTQEFLPATKKISCLRDNIKFFFHYCAVSATVFAVLLVAANWSAYWAIASSLVHPEGMENAARALEATLSESKITVYANDGITHSLELKEKAVDIKKQLDAENITVSEDPFSMKHLLPTEPNISGSFVITPYENRIVIPKIGKNIPLVDVPVTSSFDFDHMENIFMKELEKWIVRYPGTAVPGDAGNSFIFGHSSNYPWMKGEYNDVFALLDHVSYGDQIIVYYNQKKYVYTVKEKKIVKPGDVRVLERDPTKKELSLMTCWPIGTTLKRMIVFSELTEVN